MKFNEYNIRPLFLHNLHIDSFYVDILGRIRLVQWSSVAILLSSDIPVQFEYIVMHSTSRDKRKFQHKRGSNTNLLYKTVGALINVIKGVHSN